MEADVLLKTGFRMRNTFQGELSVLAVGISIQVLAKEDLAVFKSP